MLRLLPISALVMLGCPGPVQDSAEPLPVDRDRDGYISDQDCDDRDAEVHPGAVEVCNGVDDDCDGYMDDDDPETQGRAVFHIDADLDSFGSADPHQVRSFCVMPEQGWVSNDSDCDDGDPAVHPGASEECNGYDDDCDEQIDEGSIGQAWYPDLDGDGYGISVVSTTSCDQPSGTAAVDGDCNDDDAAVNPGATEWCNTIDDDCDGEIDEGVGPDTWYRDADGDGFGTSVSSVSCGQPSGFAASSGDCDDDNPAINPGVSEQCNGYDDDCDMVIDGAGLVTFVSAYAVVTDMSAAAASGTASAPYQAALTTRGTLSLCSGSYHMNLSVESSELEVVGVDGSAQVLLTGDGSSSVIAAGSAASTLGIRGISIAGGGAVDGGCIHAGDHGVDLEIFDVQLSDCSASGDGGGLYQQGGTISASQLAISSSGAVGYGGGAYLRDVTGSITASSFEANQARYGGGLLVQDSELLFEDADIVDNLASDAGGGLYATGGAVELDASLVQANVAAGSSSGREAVGGGIFLNDGVEFTCTGASAWSFGFLENQGDVGGGAFLYDSASVLISSLCDWGSASSDNTPDDVTVLEAYQAYDDYEANESFTCTGEGCG